jgi:hypothetical protein
VVHSSSSQTSSRRGGSGIGGSGAFPHRFGSGGIGEDPDGSVFDGGPIGGVYENDLVRLMIKEFLMVDRLEEILTVV